MTDQSRRAGRRTATFATGRRCPICGKPALAETRPFCSRRCADVDLSRWLGGTYRIPVDPSSEEDGDGRQPDGGDPDPSSR